MSAYREQRAMIQFDLTSTQLAKSREAIPIPSEGELTAVSLALMLAADCSWSELENGSLALTEQNQEAVAELIEKRLTPLTRDIGRGKALRHRLGQLAGLAVGAIPEGVLK